LRDDPAGAPESLDSEREAASTHCRRERVTVAELNNLLNRFGQMQANDEEDGQVSKGHGEEGGNGPRHVSEIEI